MYLNDLIAGKMAVTKDELNTAKIMNEILPMAFASLRQWMASQNCFSDQHINHFSSLGSFLIFDPDKVYLILKMVQSTDDWSTLKSEMRSLLCILEFITRIYTLDSKKYKKESVYWMAYAFRVTSLLLEMKVPDVID